MSEARPSIIGVVGQPLSGKDTVAGILIDHGYTHVSTSDLIRDYIREHDLGELSRPLERDTANALRAEHGPDYLVRLALERHPRQVVVTAIRAVAEAEYLKAAGGRLVWVEASEELRFARLAGRNRPGDALTLAEFQQQEAREHANPDPTKQNVLALEALADVRVTNDGDLAALTATVERDVLGVR